MPYRLGGDECGWERNKTVWFLWQAGATRLLTRIYRREVAVRSGRRSLSGLAGPKLPLSPIWVDRGYLHKPQRRLTRYGRVQFAPASSRRR